MAYQKKDWVWIKYTLNESGAIHLIAFCNHVCICMFEKNKKSEIADITMVGDV